MACLNPTVTSVTGVTSVTAVTDKAVTHVNTPPIGGVTIVTPVTPRTVLAIDPGLSGAYAVLDASGAIVEVDDLPLIGTGTKCRIDAANFAAIVRRLSPDRSILEAVNAMPGQGVSSMFRFGQSLGTIAGVLGACGVPVQWVTPAKWKRDVGIGADKEAGRQRAIETWPSHATVFARKLDHGRAEAALLAQWGIRNDK